MGSAGALLEARYAQYTPIDTVVCQSANINFQAESGNLQCTLALEHGLERMESSRMQPCAL